MHEHKKWNVEEIKCIALIFFSYFDKHMKIENSFMSRSNHSWCLWDCHMFKVFFKQFVCSRYRRKGNSALGLDPRKQEVSWEESDSNKKRKSMKKKAADRYYSAVSHQMLKTEAPVSIFPTISEYSATTSPASFLLLTDEENIKREPGRRCSHNSLCSIKKSTCYLFQVVSIM